MSNTKEDVIILLRQCSLCSLLKPDPNCPECIGTGYVPYAIFQDQEISIDEYERLD